MSAIKAGDSTKIPKKSVQIVPSSILTAKIIVIGAGAAGLAAAVKLLDYGFKNIKILEAENRIGGRIHSVPYGKGMVDLGAQWCHGEVGNVVYEMVKTKNLLQTSKCTYKDNTFYNSSGKLVDKDLTDELFGFAANIANDLSADDSFGHYFQKNFIKKILKEYEKEGPKQDVATQFIRWFHKLVICYDSAPNWYQMGTSDEYKWCEGDSVLNWKSKGYLEFLNVLKQKHAKLLDEEIIHLEKSVKTIVWNNSYSTEALIHCQDGSFYDAHHIIVTTPLGVLKEKYKSMFIPDLPPNKIKAIEMRGFGCVNKVLLKFPHRWWDDTDTCFCFLWNEADRLNILNEFPHGPSKDGKSWLEDINGFFTIDSDETILLGWLLGDQTRDTEELADEIIEKGCIYLLNKFLGSSYNIPKAEKILVSRWAQNQNFRGSYSFSSVEGEKEGVRTQDLMEPLVNPEGKPVIQFAGEATHPWYFSTVHGAVETGWREATRLFDYYSKKKDEEAHDAPKRSDVTLKLRLSKPIDNK